MNESKEKLYTLAQALKRVRTVPNEEELQSLYAPRLDQAPPANPPLGGPVPTDIIVKQPVSPNQPRVALKPIERSLTKDEQQAFTSIWTAIDATQSEQTAKAAKLELWGFTKPIDLEHLPENVFTFNQALDQDWCPYRYPKRFLSFLQKYGYPEDLITLGIITRIGYEKLVAKKLNDQRVRKTQNKQQERADQATSGKQVLKPNKRQSSNKPRAFK